MDFDKPLRKKKSQVKYEAFYCLKIQSQRLTADKLLCSYIENKSKLFKHMLRKQSGCGYKIRR